MTLTTYSSRQFDRNPGRAKLATAQGPVVITDRGEPSHVLLSIEEYRRLAAAQPTIVDLLAMPGGEDIVFDVPRAQRLGCPVEFD